MRKPRPQRVQKAIQRSKIERIREEALERARKRMEPGCKGCGAFDRKDCNCGIDDGDEVP